MDLSPNSEALQTLRIENIVEYLELSGWTSISHNDRWYVLIGSQDVHGAPLEIVLPKNSNTPDVNIYLASAVNLVSAVTNESPEDITKDIRFYDRDLLMISNTEIEDNNSIPISLAATQVYQFKSLIAYSTCSEEDAKPFFNSRPRIANSMVNHFRFGHTFISSFGYTVESPLTGTIRKYIQKSLTDDVPDEVIIPLERRVMERVVRGLLTTQLAVQNQNMNLLIDGYAYGFNANMCFAITKISDDKQSPIKYAVKWSKKLEPSQDLVNVNPVTINKQGYRYLEEAGKVLRELKPEYVTIIGLVTGLSSQDDPLGSKITDRSVIVRWLRPQGRPVNVRIVLSKDDYILAHKAHLDWKTISVSGIVQNIGNNWRLSDVQDFKILR